MSLFSSSMPSSTSSTNISQTQHGMLRHNFLIVLIIFSESRGEQVIFTCGPNCSGTIDSWCDNGVRVRIFPFREPPASPSIADDIFKYGALASENVLCQQRSSSHQREKSIYTQAANGEIGIVNNHIQAIWANETLAFFRTSSGTDERELLLRSILNGSSPFHMAPAPSPSPAPGPYQCVRSCATSIVEHHDVIHCDSNDISTPVISNISRDACCSACGTTPSCAVFSWGRESADAKHRRNCYLCNAHSTGLVPRADRDTGCTPTTADASLVSGTIVQEPKAPSSGLSFYRTRVSFSSTPDEVITGLGQHSYAGSEGCTGGKDCGQWKLNQKGFSWELGISKFQIMVPWYVSSRQYGFLWNHPGTGTVSVNNNNITWGSDLQRGIEFWVTTAPATPSQGHRPSNNTTTSKSRVDTHTRPSAGDKQTDIRTESVYAAIMRQYADATGHAPVLPDYALGFWQSKCRYRTSDELVDIVDGYNGRNVSLAVIVIDYYTWTKFGDFQFDAQCWPNITEVTKLVAPARILRSTYPWMDQTSVNYNESMAQQVLVRNRDGGVAYVAEKDMAIIDPFASNASCFVWDRVKTSFFDQGIEMFWLDDTEPNIDQSGLVYACGPAEYCGALWPQKWVEIFTNGTRSSGIPSPVMLSRAAWAGFQTTGAVVWSSDIPSTFASLRVQVRAGLSLMMSGIPWWTTDVGGFTGGDIRSAEMRELIVRWYQYGALCPIFRTHGNREPSPMPPLPPHGRRFREEGAHCNTPNNVTAGAPNEIWSYGSSTEILLTNAIRLRESLLPYLKELAHNVSSCGSPPMRPLFYDFPDDPKAYDVDDEFMLGPRYLVAPVLYYKARNRTVYFPSAGPDRTATLWTDYWTHAKYTGNTTHIILAPLDTIPLFVLESIG
eukprot:m.1123353 g.1123353  ORF g.1123353 m.1123353 type:complete len:893 (-) comp24405_c0_seq1:378-3056(-)